MLMEDSGADPDVHDQDQLPFSRSVASTYLANPRLSPTTPFPPERSRCAAASPVGTTDGDIRQVQGLVVDSGSHQVTHVLLQAGHVFGRRVVAIPIGDVTGVNQDGIQFNITKQQVRDLPSGWHRSLG